jgi:hypothetical protein
MKNNPRMVAKTSAASSAVGRGTNRPINRMTAATAAQPKKNLRPDSMTTADLSCCGDVFSIEDI